MFTTKAIEKDVAKPLEKNAVVSENNVINVYANDESAIVFLKQEYAWIRRGTNEAKLSKKCSKRLLPQA